MSCCKFLCALAIVASSATASAVELPATASSAAPAMAILKNNCLSCHNPEKKKGKLLLTSRDLALKGNEDGPVIILGNGAQSKLIAALSADADPHMPPKKQLDAAEIAALRDWIDGGAPWDDAALASSAPTTRPVELHAMPSSYRPVLAIALSPDEKQLAIGRRDRVYLRDLKQPARPIVRELEGPADAVRALAWNADGSRLAAGGYRRVRVWQMQSNEEPIDLDGLEGRITALCFVPQSDMLLAADGIPGGGGRIVVYQLPDPQPRNIIAAHADSIFALKCTRDGKHLASGGADKLVKLWDLPTFKPAGALEGHTSHVLSLAFNSDDSLLASGGADKDIKIWDIKTHEQKQSIGPHPFRVDAIAWPNGRSIVAAGDDGGLRRDNDNANAPGAALPGADDVLYCLAVTADGANVFGGCHDGAVYVWVGGKIQTRLLFP